MSLSEIRCLAVSHNSGVSSLKRSQLTNIKEKTCLEMFTEIYWKKKTWPDVCVCAHTIMRTYVFQRISPTLLSNPFWYYLLRFFNILTKIKAFIENDFPLVCLFEYLHLCLCAFSAAHQEWCFKSGELNVGCHPDTDC